MISRRIASYNNLVGAENRITETIVHTGQHYDNSMSRVFFDELEIPKPYCNLDVGSSTHGMQTGMMLARIEEVLLKEKPDRVLVYGDTNSTLAGAIAAVKLNIPVAHVEAGLRSFNKRMPEEVNRVITDHISSLLFCPTESAVENLKREGITEGVYKVGDVMYDSVLYNLKKAEERSEILNDLKIEPKGYFLSTLHRQENTDDPERLASIFTVLSGLDYPIIIPMHPRTKKTIEEHAFPPGNLNKLMIIPPVSYLDMLILEKNARLILTDSGGVQKEAYFFKIPCITLRDETEWVETVEAGWNRVAGADPAKIREAIEATISIPLKAYQDFYGDGKASERILEILIKSQKILLA